MHQLLSDVPVLATERKTAKRNFAMKTKGRQGFGQENELTSERIVRSREPDARLFRLPPIMLSFAVLLISLLMLSACSSQPTARAAKNSVVIESVRLTAAGHYVDLRYRVLDAEKASQIIGPGVKPLLIDEATGTVMAVPMTAKLGSLRQTRGVQKPDHLYFILFVNGAGLRSGSVVTAEIGDMRFESLIVE